MRLTCLAILGLLLFSQAAQAHGIKASARTLPFWQIQVESWFDSGERAARARVVVYQEDASELVMGRLNQDGVFVFVYQQSAPLRVVVNAGVGHRTELAITRKTLNDRAIGAAVLAVAPPPALFTPVLLPPNPIRPLVPQPVSPRSGPAVPVRMILLGVGILVLIAGALAYRKRSLGRSQTH